MAPIDADNDRSRSEKGCKRDEPAVLVGKVKLRHRFAKPRTDLAAIDHIKSLNKLIVSLGEIGSPKIAFSTISRQPETQAVLVLNAVLLTVRPLEFF
jgi:hypothetical protein